MPNIKLDQVGGKVKGTVEDQPRPITFPDMAAAIIHCNNHGYTITNAEKLSPYFQSLINSPHEPKA